VKKFVLLALSLIVVVAGALVYHTLTKPAPKATDLLPESTLVFVDIPDFAKSRAEFQKTAVYALWREPELQAFLEKPRQALREAFGQHTNVKEEEGLAETLLDALQGEAFLAVTHVALIPNVQAGVVLGVDVKRKRLETAAVLYKLEKRLKAQFPNARFGAQRHLGVKYSVWEFRSGYPVCHASLNSLVVFTLGEDTMHDVIARFKQQSQSPSSVLSTSAKYRNIVSRMPDGYEGLAFFNMDQLMQLVGPFMMVPQVARTFQKLASIQAAGNSIKFVDGGIQDVAFVAYNKDTAPKPRPATQRKSLAFTSPQTLLYAANSSDLAGDYDDIMQSLAQSGYPNVASGALQFEQTLRGRGIHMREDVLAYLGPETALIATWREGARVPDVALVAEIRDAAKVRPALDTALGVLKEITLGKDEQAPWDQTEYLGQTLRSVSIGAGLVTPTYVITDKFFILGLTPDYVRELLSQADGAKSTLATNPDYEKSMQRLPANGNAYTFCSLRGIFEPLYGLAQSGLSTLGPNTVVSADKLPKPETIARHLSPYASATVTDERGATTTAFSPVGSSLAFVAGAGIAAGIVIPQIVMAQHAHDTTIEPPTTSSDTDALPSPPENQMEESQTPATQ
jgi:hypothetical protein